MCIIIILLGGKVTLLGVSYIPSTTQCHGGAACTVHLLQTSVATCPWLTVYLLQSKIPKYFLVVIVPCVCAFSYFLLLPDISKMVWASPCEHQPMRLCVWGFSWLPRRSCLHSIEECMKSLWWASASIPVTEKDLCGHKESYRSLEFSDREDPLF